VSGGAAAVRANRVMNAEVVKRITYVATAVLVDDDFGGMLLEYAAALARDGSSETIEFRGVNEHDLRAQEVSFIVGPASEIVVEKLPEDTPAQPPDNAETMAKMQARIAELEGQRPAGRHSVVPEPASEMSPLVDGLDI
jgi:hypothetical protein